MANPYDILANQQKTDATADLSMQIVALRSELNRLKRENSYFTITHVLTDNEASSTANYSVLFVAPFACEVVEAWETHRTAATQGTLYVEKETPGQAHDAGVNVLSSTWDITLSADHPRRVKASQNIAIRSLNPGDRLVLNDTGTFTQARELVVTILCRVLNYTVSRLDTP